jgi:hypothetical protein
MPRNNPHGILLLRDRQGNFHFGSSPADLAASPHFVQKALS